MSIFKESYNKQFKDFVCVDEMGNLRKPDYVSHKFKQILKNNGLREIRFHDLRHTVATRLAESNIDLVVVKEILGHADIQTTMRYAHAVPKRKQDAISVLNSYS